MEKSSIISVQVVRVKQTVDTTEMQSCLAAQLKRLLVKDGDCLESEEEMWEVDDLICAQGIFKRGKKDKSICSKEHMFPRVLQRENLNNKEVYLAKNTQLHIYKNAEF